MTPATVKIKTKLFERGDSIAGLANRWGLTRALLTKVIHGERHNADAKKRLARYMGIPVKDLFAPNAAEVRTKAA